MSTSLGAPMEGSGGAYAGWIAAGIVILAVLAMGAALWFKYHP